ncbi:hypothetical protein ACHQM5_007268 [Ranunculus cassubicifolius]
MDCDNENPAIGEEAVPAENPNAQKSSSPKVGSPLTRESVGSGPDTLSESKRRKVGLTTEEVWNHMDKVNFKKLDGSIEPRARCRYCDVLISYDSTLGVYHLKKHSEDCIRKMTAQIRKEDKDPRWKNPKNFVFDQAIATREAVRFIINAELAFNMAETPEFVTFSTLLNPQFKPIRSRIVRNVVMKFFEEEKPILQSLLKITPGKVCISANLWTTEEGRGYMCITAHYVDADWKLNKRVISFPALEMDCSDKFEVVEGIHNSILDWGMGERILTVTLDDTVSAHLPERLNVPERLKEVLILHGSSVCKKLFHVPCGTQILNCIVQEGLEGFHQSIEYIRDSVLHVVHSEERLQKFKELSKSEGLEFRKLYVDLLEHWNTTYLLLKAAIPYQRIFELLFSDSTFHHIPTALDWKNATVMRDILKVFYESAKLLAGSKYVSSSAFVLYLANICLVLSRYEGDPSCSSVIAQMKAKMRKCFVEIPLALGLAVCMDPRYKISFLELCLDVLFGDEESHELERRLETVRSSLYELFEEYKQRFESNGSVSTLEEEEEENPIFAMFAKRQIRSSELECYLQQPSLRVGDRKTFDVLGWWKEQEVHSPVLSAMARDLLTVPVSSVPLHWAFTSDARVVNENRTIWPDEVIEATVCLKDWQDGEDGKQDKGLDDLEDLYEDEEEAEEAESDSDKKQGLQDTNMDEDDDDEDDNDAGPDADMKGQQGLNVEAVDDDEDDEDDNVGSDADMNSDGEDEDLMQGSGSGSE